MPPADTGLMTGPDVAMRVGTGEGPDRMTVESDMHWNGEVEPFPLTPGEVDKVAVST